MLETTIIGKHAAKTGTSGNMVLVSLPFTDYFNNIYNNHVEPALEECGFKPYRIKISSSEAIADEEFTDSIKKAKFMIADITNGNFDAYFVSGFLKGLKRPVIYTAKAIEEGFASNFALATKVLKWRNPTDLKNKLIKQLIKQEICV